MLMKTPFRLTGQRVWITLAAESLRFHVALCTQVHYEDLAALPKETLTELLKSLELPNTLDFSSGDEVDLAAGHHVRGNPIRLPEGSST